MERIKRIIRSMNSLANDPSSNVDSILNGIVEGVHDYFYADVANLGKFMVYVVLHPDSRQGFRLPAVHPPVYQDSLKLALEKLIEDKGQEALGISYEAFRSRESQRIADVSQSKLYQAYQSSSLPKTCSQLSIPIIASRRRPRPEHSYETIGVISVESEEVNAFSAEHQVAIELLADYAAGIIDNKRNAQALEALQAATRELSSALSVDNLVEVCQSLVKMAVGILHSLHQEIAYCHVGLLEQENEERVLHFKASLGNNLSEVLGSDKIYLDRAEQKMGIIGRCIRQNISINVGDVREDPDYIRLDERVRSQLAIPIKIDDAILGAISVEYFDTHAFDLNEQAILESLAGSAAIAIQNLRMRLALQEITRAEAEYHDISDVLKLVREKTIELATFRKGKRVQAAIGIVNKEGGVKYDKPLIAEESEPLILKAGEGLSQHVIRTGKDLYRPMVQYDADYIPRDPETVSEFLTPISVGNSVMAILSLQSPAENAFNEYSFQMARLFARQAAIAIRNHRLFRTLRKLHEISSQSFDKTSQIPDLRGFRDFTTEQIPELEETENYKDTQEFISLSSHLLNPETNLLMKAIDEEDLAMRLYHISRDIISFNREALFENILIAFIPREDEKIVHLYDFAQIDKLKRPSYEHRLLSELTLIQRVLGTMSIISSYQDKVPSLPAYQEYESFVFAPLILDKVKLGAIGIFSHRKAAFNSDDEWMLQNIADRAAEAYSNFRRVRRLNEGVLALHQVDNHIIRLLLTGDAKQGETALEPIWKFIVNAAKNLTGADGASLFTYDAETRSLKKVFNDGELSTSLVGHQFALHEIGLVSILAARSKAISTLADLKESPREEGVLSSVAIPLLADERDSEDMTEGKLNLVGVLNVRSQRENAFDSEKIDLLKALSGQAVVALRYAKLLSGMGDLFNTNLRLSSLNDEEAAETTLKKALEFIAPKVGLRGMIYKLDIATAKLERLCAIGFDESDSQFLASTEILELDAKNGISEAANARYRVLIKDVKSEAHYKFFYQNTPIRSLLSVAIYGSREMIEGQDEAPKVLRGVLTVMSSEPNAFHRIDRRLMIYFANQMELAWSYVAQRRRMIELAHINREWGKIAQEQEDETAWASLKIWDKVQRLIGTVGGAIFEKHRGKGTLSLVDGNKIVPNFKKLLPEIAPYQGAAAWVAATEKPLNIPKLDALKIYQLGDDYPKEQVLYHIEAIQHIQGSSVELTFSMLPSQSLLAVPIRDDAGDVRAVIQVESPVAHAFDANDLRFLQVLGNQAWAVIDSRQNQRHEYDSSVLPTFFAMLHDQKGVLAGLRLHLQQDEQKRYQNEANDLRRYVSFLDEAQRAFRALSKQQAQESEIMSIGELLRETKEQYGGLYPDLLPYIEIDSSEGESYFVEVDTRLIYIFRNLLSNALSYGKAPFMLRAKIQAETKMVAFSVEDKGTGIAPDLMRRIFEPKFGTGEESWGMGLWFSKMFVQSLGGTIEVKSNSSEGTCFSFWIPLAEVD